MTSKSNGWSFEQNKRFEGALATALLHSNSSNKKENGPDDDDRWEKLAMAVGDGKTAEDVKRHYYKLEEDIMLIESGAVPLPKYKKSAAAAADMSFNNNNGNKKIMATEEERMRSLKLR